MSNWKNLYDELFVIFNNIVLISCFHMNMIAYLTLIFKSVVFIFTLRLHLQINDEITHVEIKFPYSSPREILFMLVHLLCRSDNLLDRSNSWRRPMIFTLKEIYIFNKSKKSIDHKIVGSIMKLCKNNWNFNLTIPHEN